MEKVKWYKYEYLWRRGDDDGDNSPSDRDDGTGDIIFNTMTKIIEAEDTSDWAVKSFSICALLLRAKKRWPDIMNRGTEASNRWEWYPYLYAVKLCRALGIDSEYVLTRPQNDMTRDPYTAFGACYSHLIKDVDEMNEELVENAFLSVTPPWYTYIFNPSFIIWWKRLRKNNRPHYVKRLNYYESLAVTNMFKKYYEDDFYKDKNEL